MTRLARSLSEAAEMWRQFEAAVGWPLSSASGLPGAFPGEGLAAPHGVNGVAHPPKQTAPTLSLLDRVFPLDLCDFEHADRVHRTYLSAGQ